MLFVFVNFACIWQSCQILLITPFPLHHGHSAWAQQENLATGAGGLCRKTEEAKVKKAALCQAVEDLAFQDG